MIEDLTPIEEQPPAPLVPWTARDAWWGVAALIAWLMLAVSFAVAALWFEWEINLSFALVVGELSLMIPVWLIAFRKYEVDWQTLGFRPLDGKMILLGFGFLMLFYGFNICFNLLLAQFEVQGGQDLSTLLEQPDTLLWAAVSAVLIAPIVEEVFFRGFLFAGFREKYGWKKAALISAILFSLVHLTPTTVLPIFILGYLFAYLYHKSGSLWLPILLHFAVNGFTFFLLGIVYLLNSFG